MTGIYVRVKRKDKWDNIEFELLDDKEMEEFVAMKQEQKQDGWSWAVRFAKYLRDTVKPLMDGLVEDGILEGGEGK